MKMNQKEFEKKYVNKIIHGKCRKVMKDMPDNCIDTIITDPPYGLEFMGQDWDKLGGINSGRSRKENEITAISKGPESYQAGKPMQEWHYKWTKRALRIAKPGAMMFVFGGTRTFHRLTCAIEDAGWEIRDCMMWLYGSGFPKSLDISKAIDKAKGAEREVVKTPMTKHSTAGKGISNELDERPWMTEAREKGYHEHSGPDPATDLAKQWDGYGTALKPAWEPIIVAMKPLDGTFAQNAEKWGVGGLWIDGGRIGTETETHSKSTEAAKGKGIYGSFNPVGTTKHNYGRWPANVILDEEAGVMLDGQSGVSKSNARTKPSNTISKPIVNIGGGWKSPKNEHTDSGGASRFFYCAKASRSERNAGLEGMEAQITDDGREKKIDNAYLRGKTLRQNNHPTVKPLKLMEYLCKLTKTPDGGVVLDPFGGSGTTAVACRNTGRPYILIEKDPHYCEIARARVKEARAGQGALFG